MFFERDFIDSDLFEKSKPKSKRGYSLWKSKWKEAEPWAPTSYWFKSLGIYTEKAEKKAQWQSWPRNLCQL